MKTRGPIQLGPKQTSRSNLNLLEILFDKKRTSIKSDASKKKVNLSDYEMVSKYIKDFYNLK